MFLTPPPSPLSPVRHVPDWFPGTEFKQVAKRWRHDRDKMLNKPHAFVKDQMAAGTARPSYTNNLLEKLAASPPDDPVDAEMDIKWLQRDFNLYIVNLFDTYRASVELGEHACSVASSWC